MPCSLALMHIFWIRPNSSNDLYTGKAHGIKFRFLFIIIFFICFSFILWSLSLSFNVWSFVIFSLHTLHFTYPFPLCIHSNDSTFWFCTIPLWTELMCFCKWSRLPNKYSQFAHLYFFKLLWHSRTCLAKRKGFFTILFFALKFLLFPMNSRNVHIQTALVYNNI